MSKTKMVGAIALIALGLFILGIGLFLSGGGAYLIVLGGSWYFALAGLGFTAAGALIARRRPLGITIYLAVFFLSMLWALWDVGLEFWPLVSRLYGLAALAFIALLLCPALRFPGRKPSFKPAWALASLFGLGLAVTTWQAFQPMPLVTAEGAPAPVAGTAVGAVSGSDWPHYGRTLSGTRFAPLEQLTPANVGGLEVAWTYRTGEVPTAGEAHVVTPLHINGALYGCTQSSKLFALDSETGKELWRYDPNAEGKFIPRCRGVAYHDGSPMQANQNNAPAACDRRILSTTVDARLVAVDAQTGELCTDFGNNGIVDLEPNMGEVKPGFYFPTAAPTVARNLIIIGGLIRDNHDTDEPSGVVRAFHVRTGELVWAWDSGNPAITRYPPEGESYTRGTPNVWTAIAFDDVLGLVYLPTGNATPDFWGGHRSEAADRYSSSVVALDIETGRERWRFQTVHHDIWDYDVSSQPALYDVPDGNGGTIPGLIQTTKQGQIFLLDRRNGLPIADVEERSVPQSGVPDERVAPTQPFSVGMPSIGAESFVESDMWGATPLDQLMCRIDFKRSHYEGRFTPTTENPSLQFPGWSGGMNWGSVSIAENTGYLIVNDIRMGFINQLVPRAVFDAANDAGEIHGGNAPQYGTPWGLLQRPFVSPLDIPCQRPPYGTVTAIDLATRKIVWSMPMGTVEDAGPLGIAMRMHIPIGMPTLGGPVTTQSGLIFMAGTQDNYIRALDLHTGKELWRGRLPVGANTTPITYVSPDSGRQFLVISAGGSRSTPTKGDYIIAFALPQ